MKILILSVLVLFVHGVARLAFNFSGSKFIKFFFLNSEYVSVLGPKAVQSNSTYRVFVAGHNIGKNSKVIVQFGSKMQYFTSSNFGNQIAFVVSF